MLKGVHDVNFAIKAALLTTFIDANRVTYKVSIPAATRFDRPTSPD